MPKISTPNKIVLFLYNECTLEDSIQVSNKIRTDAKAENLFSQLANTIERLSEVKLSPSQSTIDKILANC